MFSQNFKKNLINLYIIFGFFILPIVLFLRPENLAQTNIKDVTYLVFSQAILFCFFFLVSKIVHKKIFNNKIIFIDFLCLNSFIFFLLFFYKKINLFFEKIDQSKLFVFKDIKISIIDNLIVILIYFIIFIIFFIFIQNYNKKVKQLFFLFISLNLILFIFNSVPKLNQYKVKINKKSEQENIIKSLNNINFKKTIINTNIFVIVLDGMINLDRAEKESIIKSKENVENKLANYGFKYNKNFKSNFSSTYLSIATLLTSNYPVTPNSSKYTNRANFFPNMMSKTNNFFYSLMDKINANFIWIGNYWGPCVPNLYTTCLTNDNKINFYLAKISKMYDDSIFRYFTIYYFKKFPFRDSYELLSNHDDFFKSFKKDNNKKNFIFIHMMKPHPPYDRDKECNKIDAKSYESHVNRKKYYSYNYECALETSLKFSNEFSKINQDNENLFIILGDHGWNFNPKNLEFEENDKNFLKDRLNNVFYAYKSPERCQNLKTPETHVNVMRYILNCIYTTNVNYLDNNQYITRYETHPDYGKVFEFNE